MDYLDSRIDTIKEQKFFSYVERGRSRILDFGYEIIAFRNGIKKALKILRKLLISSNT